MVITTVDIENPRNVYENKVFDGSYSIPNIPNAKETLLISTGRGAVV